MFKKMITAVLAMSILVLSGCSGKSSSSQAAAKTPEELTALYAQAITANGGEMVEYNPVLSEVTEESAMLLEMMGLKEEDMAAFGVSTTMMNVKAYGIAAVMPVEGKTDAVKESLQGFIDQKQMEFEFYLPDQRPIAENARLEVLEDGTVLMVMIEDQDTVFENISNAILGK